MRIVVLFICDLAQIYTWRSRQRVRPSVRPSVTPYVVIYDVNSSQNIVDVCPSHLFDHVPIVGSSRNRYGRCILGRVTILGMFRGWPIFGSTGTGDKLVIFGHFFVLSRTPPTVLIGERYKRTGMFLGTIRKTYRKRNFEFLSSRSDIDLSRSNIEIVIWLP